MTFYYSKSQPGFYTREMHGDTIPKDAVPITDEEYHALYEELAKGKMLQSDHRGYPIAIDRPPITPEQWAEIHLSQRRALIIETLVKSTPLQDAVDLERATDEEKQRLKAWKLYRIKLSRIEQQSGFPTKIDWPKAPEATSWATYP
ncbi:Uncharacterized protein MCB1EB_1822 [Mycoavidus cysteinexigens]|uniref:Uncharacterized protein n=1 Tax=Mycoavidus cysteinexigens TaxID=1553431 RepID=A0A2Z6EX01_9BURK|nr:tail assembly chaperone [Mycoavidus cysteinexigens]BBE09983.1 Uncharacterized protein MCB1EB_1822 [Mycoavidus cysteinexigens]GAM53673.1 tail fiber assembly protein [bacterium endosymbiont of Mortierella elongata FMR23-6]GLR02279.1 phage tail fiber protein [Mycoavidus cysteinexigens]